MEKIHCPYLGIIDDPTSHKDFPFEGNACHRVKKPVKVATEYQNSHCLCDAYRECPGYTNGWEEGFPIELRADYDPENKNLIKSILLWKEQQQNKLARKKAQREERNWKELIKNKLQFRKEQPSKEKEKIVLDEETVPIKDEGLAETIQVSEPESQEKTQEKKILEDETALKEYLRSKRGINKLLTKILPWKKKSELEKKVKKARQVEQGSKTEEKTKRDWKKAFVNIIPWKKKREQKAEGFESPEKDKALGKEKRKARDWKQAFTAIIPWKKKREQSQKEEPASKIERPSKPEKKPKRDWKLAILSILPWRKVTQSKKTQEKAIQPAKVEAKEKKQKKSLKEVLQNILPWKREKRVKQDRKALVQGKRSPHEEEQIIESREEAVQKEETPKEKLHSIEEEPEALPNEWVKEEQLPEDKQEVTPQELPQWEERILSDQEEKTPVKQQANPAEEELPDIMAWREKHVSKGTKKEGFLSKLRRKKEKPKKESRETSPQGAMALRDKKKEEAAWKNVFKNKRVWWVSLGIILIFLLMILIPQIPSFNLNLRDRFEGLFNPPIAATTDGTPTSIPEGITQTDSFTSATTEVPAITTPGDQTTPTLTYTVTITPTSTFTSTITSTPTPGVAPFIYLTQTDTPEP